MVGASTRRRFLATVAALSTGCVAGRTPEGNVSWSSHVRTRPPHETGPSPVDPERFRPVGRTVDLVTSLSEWSAPPGTEAVADDGSGTPASPPPFRGDRSLRLEGEQGVVATAEFDEPLDARNSHLSVAMYPEKPPTTDPFTVQLLAPDRANCLVCRANYEGHFDPGWLRYDLSVDRVRGEPDPATVRAVRFDIENVSTRCWLDDLRLLPAPDRGKVMVMFDDIPESAYTRGFQAAREAGIPGAYGVITDAVGEEDRMSLSQLQEAERAGWELVSHSKTGEQLPALDSGTQRRYLAEAKEWLRDHAVRPADEHFVFPLAKYNRTALENVAEFHRMAYVGGRGSAPLLTDPLTVSRRPGDRSISQLRRWLRATARHRNLLILVFHHLTPETGARFRRLVQLLAAHRDAGRLDVVTPTELAGLQSQLAER
jgi:peptidoglycan/xylan/chitin deacetylase (PgdA/CDA1 family)